MHGGEAQLGQEGFYVEGEVLVREGLGGFLLCVDVLGVREEGFLVDSCWLWDVRGCIYRVVCVCVRSDGVGGCIRGSN